MAFLTTKNLKGDIFGGITAGIVALPLALAFGIQAFGGIDDPAASSMGALAGLVGATLLGFFAALFGGTHSQISGPTGPMTVITASLISGVWASSQGSFSEVLIAMSMAGLFCGLFQILFGVIKIGKYVKSALQVSGDWGERNNAVAPEGGGTDYDYKWLMTHLPFVPDYMDGHPIVYSGMENQTPTSATRLYNFGAVQSSSDNVQTRSHNLAVNGSLEFDFGWIKALQGLTAKVSYSKNISSSKSNTASTALNVYGLANRTGSGSHLYAQEDPQFSLYQLGGGSGGYLIFDKSGKRRGSKNRLNEVRKRMQKWSVILERFISPEGTFPIVGRSIPYRMATLQPLAMLAWQKRLPKELSEGQVRSALTAVANRMFYGQVENPAKDSSPLSKNYNSGGFLTIGFVGSHPNVADWYTNNGSLYMTSLAFMALGLPPTDSFWTAPYEKWTSKKAWEGDDFPKDHKWDINREILYWE